MEIVDVKDHSMWWIEGITAESADRSVLFYLIILISSALKSWRRTKKPNVWKWAICPSVNIECYLPRVCRWTSIVYGATGRRLDPVGTINN